MRRTIIMAVTVAVVLVVNPIFSVETKKVIYDKYGRKVSEIYKRKDGTIKKEVLYDVYYNQIQNISLYYKNGNKRKEVVYKFDPTMKSYEMFYRLDGTKRKILDYASDGETIKGVTYYKIGSGFMNFCEIKTKKCVATDPN